MLDLRQLDTAINLNEETTMIDPSFGQHFFSSRRLHTRYWRDWSSDVCSSDLSGPSSTPAGPSASTSTSTPTSARPAASAAGRRSRPTPTWWWSGRTPRASTPTATRSPARGSSCPRPTSPSRWACSPGGRSSGSHGRPSSWPGAGAKFVEVSSFDLHVKRARLEHADPDTLDFVPSWYGERLLALGDQRAARIGLSGPSDPTALDGVDPALVGRDQLPFLKESARSEEHTSELQSR